ncbi:MAG TPA: glycerophosphodiester phosphodiesterase [Solirubrobacteraceae bacterium]
MAHRGAWTQAPQNSLAALEAAIELGCDMVEIDVRRTRDRQLVAVHDPRIGGTPVAALDQAQLQTRVGPGQAPPLAELVERAAGRITLDVELKEDGYAEQVTRALARLTPEGHVVTSFLAPALAGVRRAAPETRTGLLLRPTWPLGLERRVRESGADFLAPHARAARAGLLSWADERGLPKSFVWTVNNRRALRTMLHDRRVAAVITDRPDHALALSELHREALHEIDAAAPTDPKYRTRG